ncbi:bifunctional 4-hydroxy-2-oxoglutarate aldolase/2-dehydro-3-deoxy-phosphogluconate aldolase [Caulobacter segnis]|uniref:bifunctional 4-hydroxy-2-oxoglutarate aldolase/2-dehydro-3-deoxy-phosphogluconate aldolase n=1 Tax=Caulobacter segnis TaxID=88688 RepID=UPI00240FADD8|nr:bifunctional 4-hydroxy-2-oxoglutarate aldolase/2-dehydro-3-deoxy-phosphogluconate aldolase [Caulobacter segnis]MDG2522275.1 bifunctional 4-hydroxy-2-oxoglutarate aldolase/2-dehydro-3-deoxy-phosphogluconate aldolase [Caulobacter segnis]
MTDAIETYMDLAPVMAVVTIADVAQAVPMAKALVAGGCTTIEVTLRTPAALDAMRAIADAVPEAVIGAGTVLSAKDLEDSAKAGAQFAISPGATPALLAMGRDGAIPYLPAIATASELMAGLEHGYRAFKFFPAVAAGGVPMLKSFGGPFPYVRFCPTGGVTLETAPDFLKLPNVACVGGSWLTPDAAMKDGDWGKIQSLAQAATDALAQFKV